MRRIDLERLWRNRKSFVWINLNTFRMRNRNQLKAVGKQRFLEFVCHLQLVTSVMFAQQIAWNTNVLIRIGHVEDSGRVEMAHLTSAHEICDEHKSFAIPNIQIRTRRRFAVQLY